MIKELKKDLIYFLSDTYNDYNWNTKDGRGFFNKLLDDDMKIQTFTLGNMQAIPNRFLLVQAKTLNIDKSILPNIGTIDFGATITINIYIEAETNALNAAIISDSYMEAISKCIEMFVSEYNTMPIVNPKVLINKYFISESKSAKETLNSINTLIVSADFTFTTKSNTLTIESFKQ